ncbi:ATP-binding protein [Cellulomonas sp. RIT-PI-Y]|uniref:ATP-binding protein n=1 Tax=Cellulomonas sp. RIT-PI-Y TaxID=3035297 RepID=UPI0021DA6563|nr:ATP-binding protein [Cellulomonas sp. RIT-PI-Y]
MSGVRHRLRHELLDLRSSPRIQFATAVDGIVLVASELMTNALAHGANPTSMCLRSDGHGCVLDVTDHAPARAPHVSRSALYLDGGLGLALAVELADRVGWYSTATTKHVWAQFVPAAL